MAKIIKGRGVKLEIGLTEAAAKVVSAITLADPGVATSTAHALADGSVAYMSDVEGMSLLDGQAFRVADGDTNTFEIEGIDTADMPAFVSGNAIPITAWATLSQSTEYQIGGGALVTDDNTCLIDTTEQLDAIMLAAETVQIPVKALLQDNAAMAKVRAVARKLGYLVFRISFPLEAGQAIPAQRIWRGTPSLPGENLAVKGSGTGSLQVTVKGAVCFLPAVAA